MNGGAPQSGAKTFPKRPGTADLDRTNSKPWPVRWLMNRTIGSWFIGVWVAVVVVGFCAQRAELFTPVLTTLTTLLVSAASVYVFWFTGFRLFERGRRCAPELRAGALADSVLETGFGAGVFMVALFGVSVAGDLRVATVGALAAGALAGNHASAWRTVATRLRSLRGKKRSTSLVAALIVVGLLSLVSAFAPPVSQDALVYHLALPAQYVAEQGLVEVPGNVFGYFPQNMEMLYALGLLLDGDALAKFYHWLFGALGAGAVAMLARTIDRRSSGLLAATIFATIPSVVVLAGWAYVDLAVAFFSTASVFAFVRYWRSGKLSWLIVAGVAAGFGAGCKYTAGMQAILLVFGVTARLWGHVRSTPVARRCRRSPLVDVAAAAFPAGVLAAPWLVRNLVVTGNPLFPFAYDIFGGEGWDATRGAALAGSLAQWGGDRGIVDTLLLPWRLTMDSMFFSPDRFDGIIGPVFLLGVPLVFLSLRSARGRIVFAALAIHFVAWAAATRQIRFLIPTLALASALVAAGLPQLGRLRPSKRHGALAGTALAWYGEHGVRHGANGARRLIFASLALGLSINVVLAAYEFAGRRPLGVVLGLESESAYLQRALPGGDYPVFEYIERTLPEDAYVFFAAIGNPGYLCTRRYYSDAIFENHTLAVILTESGGDHRAVERAFRERGFTHIMFRPECALENGGACSGLEKEQQEVLIQFLRASCRLEFAAGGTHLVALTSVAASETEQR